MKSKYQNLFDAGNAAQLEKMLEHDYKKGWDNLDPWFSYGAIDHNLFELKNALHRKDFIKTRDKAANIANFAHMIILICDNLLKDSK